MRNKLFVAKPTCVYYAEFNKICQIRKRMEDRMSHQYPHLFERIKIGNIEIKNRIFKPAAENGGCIGGNVSRHLIHFQAEQARGGAGLVISGMNIVSPFEKPGHEGHPFIESEERTFGFGELNQAIKDNGAVSCLQLGHFGSHGVPQETARCVSLKGLERPFDEEWMHLLFPQYMDPSVPKPHKEYTIEEIHELVSAYGSGAKIAQSARFDMVEVHAGHRHGLGCFLSPLTNRRTDDYGGTTEKRARILYEIIEDIQAKCGKNYPIIVRLNGVDGPGVMHSETAAKEGQQIEDTIEIAKKLEELGVAAVNISVQDTNVAMQNVAYGVAVEYAGIIRQHVNIPVLVAGSIQTPEYAEEVIASGKADMIGTARALYADPYWPTKAKTGHRDEIRPCIRCMECVNEESRYNWNGPLVCAMNPSLAKPELSVTKAEVKKKVAVVGGGPAGMEAARVASLRGHEVTLFEKRELGGSMIEAATPAFKADIKRAIEYFRNQMKIRNVKVVKKEATPDNLQGFDHVIVAAGGERVKLRIPGIDNANVYHALDVLYKQPENLGEKITIIGGGAVGAETALVLASQGKKITIIEMKDSMMENDMFMIKMFNEGMLKECGAAVHLGSKVEEIKEKSVIVVDKAGNKTEIETDNVIISAGIRPNLALRDALDKMDFEDVGTAGDCQKGGQIFDAVHAGFVSARNI
jgi:2,4-dienoyl-CoA reductase-like NADH-dependent reductase (Old Yellow Enzyme family)/thioredoxin reductase